MNIMNILLIIYYRYLYIIFAL